MSGNNEFSDHESYESEGEEGTFNGSIATS
jgi:hypothetical protein